MINRSHEIKTVLITGIAGSGGSYLAGYINHAHPEVKIFGFSRWHSTTSRDNLADIRTKIKIFEVDLTDFGSVASALDKIRPDAIFHLAAHANVRASFDTPGAVLSNNILGTSNLFEAIRLLKINPIVQLCSTSEVYGQLGLADIPVKEDAPVRPRNPYAVSKAAQDMLGLVYSEAYAIPIIRTRMFAYINPRRADLFASSFARQITRIECGLQIELSHGNLDSVRTLLDVRDAMEAYWLAVIHCEPCEIYNIGGTKTISVGEFLDQIVALSGTTIRTHQDPNLIRPTDVTLQVPSTTKFIGATGWCPRYSFTESMQFLLDFWRAETRKEIA